MLMMRKSHVQPRMIFLGKVSFRGTAGSTIGSMQPILMRAKLFIASTYAKVAASTKSRIDILQVEMVKKRYIDFSILRSASSNGAAESQRISYTWSNLAGHSSFLLLALSYLEKDFLQLRIFAASGMSLSIIFQYYREKPLWIPIRWNFLFILINASMIALLLKETADADSNMSRDEKELYHTFFESRGLKLVDYSHLMAHAEKKIMKKGTVLVREGEDNNHVHLIISGHLSVVKNKHFVARLGGHQFVGEMSFLRWQNKLDQFRHQEKVLQNIIRAKKILEIDDELGSDIIRTQKEMEIERARKGVEGVLESGEACYADVTCLEDAVTYSWSFMDLENVLKKEPAIAVVFEGLMSFDMTEKLIHSTPVDDDTAEMMMEMDIRKESVKEMNEEKEEEMEEESEGIVKMNKENTSRGGKDGRLESDHDEDMTERDKEIAEEEEERNVLEAFNTQDSGPSVDVREEYFILMDDILNNMHLSYETRKILSTYCTVNRIPLWVHLNCLQQLGWSQEEFEKGCKIHQNSSKSVKEMNFSITDSPQSSSSSSSSTTSTSSSSSLPASSHALVPMQCGTVVYGSDSRSSSNSIYDDDEK